MFPTAGRTRFYLRWKQPCARYGAAARAWRRAGGCAGKDASGCFDHGCDSVRAGCRLPDCTGAGGRGSDGRADEV
ncbi:hypothetical protein CA830_20970, partial [Burkholderia multivorans]